MCAIAGLLACAERLPQIRRMTALMSHRGPDGEGFLFAGRGTVRAFGGATGGPEAAAAAESPGSFEARAHEWLALGHRRLAILDLSPLGGQPMCYRERYWIVYNGEIYNYVELRAELEQAGHQFRSHSDTEVLLAAYAQWGTDCFRRLNGMWALALYDSQTGQLVLCRDRFGIKPLYYWRSPGQFAFASEIKAFSCLPGWQARANGQAVHDFLLTGLQDHSAETMFAGVWQLEPGCFARLDGRAGTEPGDVPVETRPEVVRWYRIEPQTFTGTLPEAAERFGELLLDCVRFRLRSDVPVGSCLSGGLDSSSIVCATHQLLSRQQSRCAQKTFSACSELPQFDERTFVEHVVRATGVEKHFVFPSLKGLLNELERVIWHQDEPFAGTSIYAQWCVFQEAAAARIKVMLDGQGADELLCGYHDFYRAFFCGLIRSGRPALAWREALAFRGRPDRALGALLRGGLDAAVPSALQALARRARRRRRSPRWLDSSVLGASFPGRLCARFRRYKSARELSLELLTGAHLQMLLHWEDRNSMAHSVEARVPFLDYRLVEFATGLPDHFKIQRGVTKTVLRLAMREVVPSAVLERRDKMGFVTPEQVWARESGGAPFRRRLAEAVANTRGILRAETADLLGESLTGGKRYDSAIWRILCFGAWMRLFNVSL